MCFYRCKDRFAHIHEMDSLLFLGFQIIQKPNSSMTDWFGNDYITNIRFNLF